MMRFARCLAAFVVVSAWPALAQSPAPTLPPGYMGVEQSRALVERAGPLRVTADIGDLSAGEKAAVAKLLEVGAIFQTVYERQLHPQAEVALANLKALDAKLGSPEATRNLLLLYRRVQSPIIGLPSGERVALLPVDPVGPGRNFYPSGITKAEVDDVRRRTPGRCGRHPGGSHGRAPRASPRACAPISRSSRNIPCSTRCIRGCAPRSNTGSRRQTRRHSTRCRTRSPTRTR